MFSSWIIKSVIQRRLFVFQWNKIESDRESNFVRFKFLKRIAVSNVLPITVRECARLCRNNIASKETQYFDIFQIHFSLWTILDCCGLGKKKSKNLREGVNNYRKSFRIFGGKYRKYRVQIRRGRGKVSRLVIRIEIRLKNKISFHFVLRIYYATRRSTRVPSEFIPIPSFDQSLISTNDVTYINPYIQSLKRLMHDKKKENNNSNYKK